jgi:hypothetical protein
LLRNVCPDAIECKHAPDRMENYFINLPFSVTNLIDRAKNHLGEGFLKQAKLNIASPEDSEVDLTAFATWANSIGLEIPLNFPWQPKMDLSVTGWPWGRHETDLLRKLAYAADRFWKNYDPNDPTTAPTNEQVSDWLKSQGVAVRTAEIMASILRADGLPTGPRK